MTNNVQSAPPSPESLRDVDRVFLSILLIGAGLLVLLQRLTEATPVGTVLGVLLLPMLGLTFFTWALYSGRFGLSIPGLILMGLGLGIVLIQGFPSLGGGAVLLGLALGFVGITFTAPFFNEKAVWWPLVPALIIGGLGVLLTIGGDALKLLDWFNVVAPVIAILVGIYIWFTMRNRHGHA